MQLGLAQLLGGLVAFILLLSGAFAAGKNWDDTNNLEKESGTAAASASLSQEIEELEGETIPTPSGLPLYKVLRVVDGDTIVVDKDGKSESLRLIGVDTPELNDSRTGVQCFAKEAAAYTKSLVEGKAVRLESDPSQGERDKYKRLLVYVFRDDGLLINRAIIAGGFGHEYTYDDPYKYQAEFKAAQEAARSGEVGLFAPNVCEEKKTTSSSKMTPKPKASPTQTAAAAVVIPVPQPPPPQTEPKVPSTVMQSAPAASQNELQNVVTASPQKQPQEDVQTQKPEPPVMMAPAEAENAASNSGSVVCSVNTYNCTDFKTQKEAQAVYEQCGGVANDVHKLDKNKDGNACDSLP